MGTFDQNNLSQLNFKFKLDRTPEIEYRAQSVIVPGMNLGTASVPTPMVPIRFPGNLTYDDLQITFLVGENMRDYISIYNWMNKLGHPDELEQYEQWMSDCSVFILDSNLNPNIQIRFVDAFPTDLTSVTFDTTLTETQYATATVTFRFTRWYINSLNG